MSWDWGLTRWAIFVAVLTIISATDAALLAKWNGRDWKWGLSALLLGPFAVLAVGLGFPLLDRLQVAKPNSKKSLESIVMAVLLFLGFLLFWFGLRAADPNPMCFVLGDCGQLAPFSLSPAALLMILGLLISLAPAALLAVRRSRQVTYSE